MKRRTFLKVSVGTATLASFGDLTFLARLPRVSAAEARLPARLVQFHADIEPLVRLLEDTPRDRVLEEVAAKIKRGTSYREIVAALMLAGVRNIQPRPVGFKFHAVLVVNSAHLASLASPDTDRWLPIFWAIDNFKSSQARDVQEGDWALAAVDEPAVPPSHRARQAFIDAMDNWDEAAIDTAVTGLCRTAGAHELFDLFARYGMRDFRELGHKEIYAANSFRLLDVIGWQHAEPVLRSLAYAQLDPDRETVNPSKVDLPADRPFRRNLENVKQIRAGWLDGKPDADATREMLVTIREGSATATSAKAVELINRGVAPQSLWDAYFDGAGELLMGAPGIQSLHAATFTNAMHYAFRHCRDEETRKLLVLQNAAFLPLYRGNPGRAVAIDTLQPLPLTASGDDAIGEIFNDVTKEKLTASRKILTYLEKNPDPRPLADAARRLIFMKGRDSHDYKFSSAVLEDHQFMAAPWRNRYLAASVFNLKGSGDSDNGLVKRTRAALG